MLMSYARFSGLDLRVVRLGGPGLGNHLFVWARFAVATRKYSLTPLAPTWFQIKRRPLTRRENDLKWYNDLFIHPPQYLRGMRRMWALNVLPRYSEDDLYAGALERVTRGVVEFKTLRGYYQDIAEDHAFIRQELLAMTRQEHLTGLTRDYRNSITMHVSRGDFSEPRDLDELRKATSGVRIPCSWYVKVGRDLRRVLGERTPIHVFSDGTPTDLAELLALPNCHMEGYGNALADLLALSAANVLVGSKGSTFSGWAAFLGRMPVIYYPGPPRPVVYRERPDADIDFDGESELPETFIETLKARLRASSA